MEDPHLAELMLVAMPVPPEGFSRLADNHVARESGGYPAILIDAGDTNPATVGPRPSEEAGNFGLPCLPVMILADEMVPPPSGAVVKATRLLWENAVQPNLVLAQEWLDITGQTPVNIEDRDVEFPWPRLIPEREAARDDEGELSYCFFCTLCCC